MIDNWFDCEHPQLVNNKYTGQQIQVPCGHCVACKNKHMNRWVAPLYREATQWKYVFFVTLTYNNRFLPRVDLRNYRINSKDLDNYIKYAEKSKEYLEFIDYKLPYCPSRDIQLFIKRLRQSLFHSTGERGTIRYFFSSDYGSTTFRPHWHGLIFTNSERFASAAGAFVLRSWSLYSRSRHKSYSIGRIEVEPAISAGKYVSKYLQVVDKLPAIYQFKDFRTRSFHSSNPPIGSNLVYRESFDEIVRGGLTNITIYDVQSFHWKSVPLSQTYLRRLFPVIPAFLRLSRVSRLELYRIMYDVCDLTPRQRRGDLRRKLATNSFFHDYIYQYDSELTFHQVSDKLDRLFYTWSRLYFNAQSLNMSVLDYDLAIETYLVNRYKNSLKKQFEYEDRFMLKYSDIDKLAKVIDISRNDGTVKPRVFDKEFFLSCDVRYNRSIKRKCDNSYLEKHPEFKQFHS